jgi:hypothetical protein
MKWSPDQFSASDQARARFHESTRKAEQMPTPTQHPTGEQVNPTSGARLDHRTYASGLPYVIVQCDDCGTVMNSGHHYDPSEPAGRRNAQDAADRHNAERHPEQYSRDIETPSRVVALTVREYRSAAAMDYAGPLSALGDVVRARFEALGATAWQLALTSDGTVLRPVVVVGPNGGRS